MGKNADEYLAVMLWHAAVGVVLGAFWGWVPFFATIGAGLAWCLLLAIIPARKARAWTPPK